MFKQQKQRKSIKSRKIRMSDMESVGKSDSLKKISKNPRAQNQES